MSGDTAEAGASGLQRLFHARSIAVVGASPEAAKIGARPMRALAANGYAGVIYPINPKYQTIDGRPCYASVRDVPGEVDVAIVAVPAVGVPAALRDCAEKRVGYAVVFSAGFAEVGVDGRALQNEVQQVVRTSELRVVGPNTAGVVFHGTAMVASFASVFMQPPANAGSGLAFVTQSGAFGVYVYTLAQQAGLGFDYYVNTGNEVDLELADFVDVLADRTDVTAVALYIEAIRDGGRFREAALKCFRRGLPVVAVKVGRSAEAARAAASHTGAMTGADAVYEAVFRDTGVLRADGVMELLDVCGLFARKRIPGGKRVGILTTTGGGGVWMADKCREVGLEVPEFVGDLRDALRSALPAFAAASNPVDLTGQMYTDRQLFQRTVDLLVQEPSIDALILVSGGNPDTVGPNVVQTIADAARASDKPLYVAWVGAPDAFYQRLSEAGVPAFSDPSRCARALGAVADYVERRGRFAASGGRPRALPEAEAGRIRAVAHRLTASGSRLAEHAAKQLFAAAGVPVTTTTIVASADEAVAVAEAMGYPVVLKADSQDLLHRSDIGAVAIDLNDGAAVRDAYRRVRDRASAHAPATRDLRVSVQPMAPRGVELIVGVSEDVTFGPVLMVGLGGVHAEVLRDYALAVLPVDAADVKRILSSLRGYRLLEGFRGSAPADVDAAAEAIVGIARVADALGDELQELEVNPLIVLPRGRGAVAVDALVVLRGRAGAIDQP